MRHFIQRLSHEVRYFTQYAHGRALTRNCLDAVCLQLLHFFKTCFCCACAKFVRRDIGNKPAWNVARMCDSGCLENVTYAVTRYTSSQAGRSLATRGGHLHIRFKHVRGGHLHDSTLALLAFGDGAPIHFNDHPNSPRGNEHTLS